MSKKTIGLIINPISGMGGSLGYKGTDGADILKKIYSTGAKPISGVRTSQALKEFSHLKNNIVLLTCPNEMGENIALKSGFDVLVLDDIQTKNTTSNDTIIAAKKMKERNVDLILFAGGDGTARNICSSIDISIPVLGIPTGVKMHSGVFGITPSNSGTIASDFIQGKLKTSLMEVLDIDEKSFRKNILLTKFYGYLKVPVENELMQGVKGQSLTTETDAVDGIAYDIVSNLKNDCLYVVGPGTTTVAIMEKLNLKSTLLGVDIVYDKKLIALDVNENQLLGIIKKFNCQTKILVSIIGNQGFVFGRGNQQISSTIIDLVGVDNIIILATENKLSSLNGKPLLVDTGNKKIDDKLRGYVKIRSGVNKIFVYKIK